MQTTAAAIKAAFPIAFEDEMPSTMSYAQAGNEILGIMGKANGERLLRKAQRLLDQQPDSSVSEISDELRSIWTAKR